MKHHPVKLGAATAVRFSFQYNPFTRNCGDQFFAIYIYIYICFLFFAAGHVIRELEENNGGLYYVYINVYKHGDGFINRLIDFGCCRVFDFVYII